MSDKNEVKKNPPARPEISAREVSLEEYRQIVQDALKESPTPCPCPGCCD